MNREILMNNYQPVICPDCMSKGDKVILGHVNDFGDLTIISWRPKRDNLHIKMQYESTMMLICMCGFGTTLYKKHENEIHEGMTQ